MYIFDQIVWSRVIRERQGSLAVMNWASRNFNVELSDHVLIIIISLVLTRVFVKILFKKLYRCPDYLCDNEILNFNDWILQFSFELAD